MYLPEALQDLVNYQVLCATTSYLKKLYLIISGFVHIILAGLTGTLTFDLQLVSPQIRPYS